jgi:serine/threonine-protein kinase
MRQHLYDSPPPFDCGSPKLESTLRMMLRKAPETRPTIGRVKQILTDVAEGDSQHASQGGLKALAQTGAAVASREAEQEAQRKQAAAEIEQRRNIANRALEILKDAIDTLFDRICNSAPAAQRLSQVDVIRLGQGELFVQRRPLDDRFIRCTTFAESKWDVLSLAIIGVKQRNPSYERSASLWYSQLPTDQNYRWREVSYYGNPLIPKERLDIKFEPFALANLSEADGAAAVSMHTYQIAFGPKPIDDEDFDEFCNRWAALLAEAANGQLSPPRVLPLQ